MSNPPYGTWLPSSGLKTGSGRAHFQVQSMSPMRRSSDGDQQALSSYTLRHAVMPQSQGLRPSNADLQPHSSGSSMTTSSLTGAMGETHISTRSQHSGSESPKDDPAFNMQGVAWTASQHQMSSMPSNYQPIQEQNTTYGSLPYNLSSSVPHPPTAGYLQYQGYNTSAFNHPSPESLSPASPLFPKAELTYQDQQFAFGPTISGPQHLPARSRPHASRSMQEQYEDEIRMLQKKVRELQLINGSARLRQKDLEMELAHEAPIQSQAYSSEHGLPSPIPTPSPQSATFQASWRARTDARVRQFCSLNRAGNALCAWHDSRRERRAYPPRMAPPGHLNCGCTYEEALFEESLARHDVGSYLPGESVRMDPALRNPLLKLLQTRYGYRDGDFERDITSGDWVEGEGHSLWENKAYAGNPNTRKIRGEDRR